MAAASIAGGGYSNGVDAGFVPGTGWFTAWVFDPAGDGGRRMMIAGRDAANASYLSIHYWRDWADKRPPICIVGPSGEEWEIDRKSSNGDGWKVTGEWPNITCEPSIVLKGYHGFLRAGVFSAPI